MKGLRLLLLGLAAGQSGCASLTGTKEIVSIDSTPRGVEVLRQDGGEKLGKTPLFTREERDRSHSFVFLGDGGKRYVRTFQCGLRWPTALLGNGILGASVFASNPATGLAIGLGAAGIDFLQGAAWTCDKPFVAKVPRSAPPEAPCRRFLVVPPTHYDEKLSDALTTAWIERTRRRLGGCHTYVDVPESKELFAYLNIDHESRVKSLKALGDRNVKALGYKARASDLVILETSARQGNAVVARPAVYDMHAQKLVQRESPLGVTPQGARGDAASGRSEWMIRAVNFMPNAVSLGVTSQALHDNRTETENDLKILEEHDKRSFPTYVSDWSVHSVDHPEGFGPWDYHLAITPELTAGYVDKRYVLTRTDEVGFPVGEPFDNRFRFFYLAALANGGVTGHTPLGAFGMSVGLGGGFFDVYDDLERKRRFEPLISLGVSYTAFVTRDVFMLLDASSYSLAFSKEPLIQHELLRVEGFQAVRVGLGWFLPQMRRFARDLL